MKKTAPLACLGKVSSSFPPGHASFRRRGTELKCLQRHRDINLDRGNVCRNFIALHHYRESVAGNQVLGSDIKKGKIHASNPATPGVQEPHAVSSPPIGNLSIVFTDIVQSTLLWEAHPVAMKAALALHDEVLRKEICSHNGYEVKSTGDGLMIAFSTTTDALAWCLVVQKRLLDAQWPPQILETDQGKEVRDRDGNVMFRGLSVRMSCHWGSPVCGLNDVTGRMDYMGPMVHRAARAIERTDGGQVSVSSDFLVALEKAKNDTQDGRESRAKEENLLAATESQWQTALNNIASKVHWSDSSQDASSAMTRLARRKDIEIHHLGEYELKGLSRPLQLFLILPIELRGRLEHYHNQLSYISSWEGLDVD